MEPTPANEQRQWLDAQDPQVAEWYAGMRHPVRKSDWETLQRLAADAEGLKAKRARHWASYLKAKKIRLRGLEVWRF